jgi:hypothetical protein
MYFVNIPGTLALPSGVGIDVIVLDFSGQGHMVVNFEVVWLYYLVNILSLLYKNVF